MRAALSALEVARPKTLREALRLLGRAAEDGLPLTPLAGGTDLFVYLNAGTLSDTSYMNLWPLRELRGQKKNAKGLRLGALETFTKIRHSAEVRRQFPSVAAAASVVGAWQIQNRATLGGNLANGSPAGDSLPALLALDARIELQSSKGSREVPFEDFYTGYRKTVRTGDELITSIFLPTQPRGTRQHFRKVGTRAAQAISKVVIATSLTLVRGKIVRARVALGSVAATVIRVPDAEDLLLGEKPTLAVAQRAAKILRDSIRPIDDIRSTGAHRLQLAGRLLELAVAEAGR